jgi:hypothetical protein
VTCHGIEALPTEYKRRLTELARSGRRVAELAREFKLPLPRDTIFDFIEGFYNTHRIH